MSSLPWMEASIATPFPSLITLSSRVSIWLAAMPDAREIVEKEFHSIVLSTISSILHVCVSALFALLVLLPVLSWYYHRPHELIRRACFPQDSMPPIFRDTDPWHNLRAWPQLLIRIVIRLINCLLFLSGTLSRPSVSRFIYVALMPLPRRDFKAYFPDRKSFARILENLDFFSPARVYERAQLYIEVSLLVDLPPDRDITAEYEERARVLTVTRAAPLIECRSCFDIFGSNKERIDDYFAALYKKRPSIETFEARFLSPIRFESGFLAATYLVGGPLAEFDEDWTKIVNAYGKEMTELDKGRRPASRAA